MASDDDWFRTAAPQLNMSEKRLRQYAARGAALRLKGSGASAHKIATAGRGSHSIKIEQGARRFESLGSDTYDYDNARSSAPSVETLQVTNTTELVISIDVDRATVRSATGSISILEFAKLEAQMQTTVANNYSLGATTTLTVERTSQINVPAAKHVRVVIWWKRVWQDGTLAVKFSDGFEVAVPYSVTVDLSFDKKQIDVEN